MNEGENKANVWRSQNINGAYTFVRTFKTNQTIPRKAFEEYVENVVENLVRGGVQASQFGNKYYFVDVTSRRGVFRTGGLYRVEKLETFRIVDVERY